MLHIVLGIFSSFEGYFDNFEMTDDDIESVNIIKIATRSIPIFSRSVKVGITNDHPKLPRGIHKLKSHSIKRAIPGPWQGPYTKIRGPLLILMFRDEIYGDGEIIRVNKCPLK
jgi:hypothetical protein